MDPETTIGVVALTVADVERSLRYYTNNLGFQILERSDGSALLGAGERALLRLEERQGAPPSPRAATGLYHFAILVPSRRHLALSLRRLAETGTPVAGFSDHKVSEAIYLSDPDGNGIEIYRDRPREDWPHQNGQLVMTTDPLDLEGVMSTLEGDDVPWQGLFPGTTIGHIHLKVADLEQTTEFYEDVLGFDLITRYGNAANFFSAGGYHHHIGTNIWHSKGKPPRPAGTAGLRWYEILHPDVPAVQATVARLQAAEIRVKEEADAYIAEDPSGIRIRLAQRERE